MQWARLDSGRVRGEPARLDARPSCPRSARAAAEAAAWFSGDDPLIFGGDLNLRPAHDPEVFAELHERFGLGDPTGPEADRPPARARPAGGRAPASAGACGARGDAIADGRLIRLSDHAPVVAEFLR